MSIISDITSIISELKKIKFFHIRIFIICFLGILAPGVLIVFYYRSEITMNYDVLKLLTFSISFTLPVVMINTIDFIVHLGDKISLSFILGCFLTAIQLYLLLYLSYFFTLRFKTFSLFVGATTLLFFVISIIILIIKGSKKKKSSNQG